MRVEEGAHRRARDRVPHDEHGVVTAVRRYNPPLVVRASGGSYLIAMTLQQVLLLSHIIVDDT